mmetsp:Transcript_29585/g.62752  ORF Transcript_29585/g.62752 Transcript_29585/m.62752 type:complete len:222 (+) Transcript_29585:109-774(+)
MIQSILNKCLVQHSVISKRGWPNHQREDGSILPAIHVRKVLEAHPAIAQIVDGTGRLTLHHAVANKSTSFEATMDIFKANPKGASIPDPVSGLYPFMTSASKDNIDASFNLLLANPSLVIGVPQVQADVMDNKKRKRGLPNSSPEKPKGKLVGMVNSLLASEAGLSRGNAKASTSPSPSPSASVDLKKTKWGFDADTLQSEHNKLYGALEAVHDCSTKCGR